MSDLEDVMGLMAALEEVRSREADVDGVIGPIEEMYALLTRYEVGAQGAHCNVCVCGGEGLADASGVICPIEEMYVLLTRYEVITVFTQYDKA